MTFSIAGQCTRTGMFGAAVTTTGIAVGARCIHVRANVGVVLTQYWTDPRLGTQGIDLLSQGQAAGQVVAALLKDYPTAPWRQFAALDRDGNAAWHHGEKAGEVVGHCTGEGCISLGNGLRNAEIPAAMVAAFEHDPDAHLAARLVAGLEGGLAAGGQPKQAKSAGLLVYHEDSFPLVNLRVDLDPQPLTRLRFLWEIYEPQVDFYRIRAVDPENAPIVP